jgi:L-rhamnose mutarotase
MTVRVKVTRAQERAVWNDLEAWIEDEGVEQYKTCALGYATHLYARLARAEETRSWLELNDRDAKWLAETVCGSIIDIASDNNDVDSRGRLVAARNLRDKINGQLKF